MGREGKKSRATGISSTDQRIRPVARQEGWSKRRNARTNRGLRKRQNKGGKETGNRCYKRYAEQRTENSRPLREREPV